VLPHRVDEDALKHFVSAVIRFVAKYVPEVSNLRQRVVRIACALGSAGERIVDGEGWPDGITESAAFAICRRIERLETPSIQQGPVVFVLTFPPNGRSTAEAVERLVHFRRRGIQGSDLFVRQVVADARDALASMPENPSGKNQLEHVSNPASSSLIPAWSSRAKPYLGSIFRLPFCQVRTQPFRWKPCKHPANSREWSAEQIASLTKHLDENGPNAELYACRGDLYFRIHELDQALEDFSRSLGIDPCNSEVWSKRAGLHRFRGELTASATDYAETVRLVPLDAAARNNLAAVLAEQRDFEAARKSIDDAIRLAPNRAIFRANRARLELNCGNWGAALEDLSHCVALDPHWDEAYRLRAHARSRLVASSGFDGADLDGVVEDLNRAVEINPNVAWDFASRAGAYLASAHFSLAVHDATRAIGLEPNHRFAYLIRGMARAELGDLKNAVDDATRATELQPESALFYVVRAWVRMVRNEWALAISDCDVALALAPDSAAAMECRGRARAEMGLTSEAISDLSRATEVDPDNPTAYLSRGVVYARQNDFIRSKDDFDLAITLDGNEPTAYCNRAVVHLHREDPAAALLDVNRSIAISAAEAASFLLRAHLHRDRGDLTKAVLDLKTALALNPKLRLAHEFVGNIHLQRGAYQDAASAFKAEIAVCPESVTAYCGLAHALTGCGQWDLASEAFRTALSLKPESATHISVVQLCVQADFHLRAQQHEAAMECLDKAISMEPTHCAALALRAYLYWWVERYHEAIADFTCIQELTKNNQTAIGGRGQVFVEVGEFAAAIEDLNHAIWLHGTDEPSETLANLLSARAIAHRGLGDVDKADCDIRIALAMSPQAGWIRYRYGVLLEQQGRADEARISFAAAVAADQLPLPPRKRAGLGEFLRRPAGKTLSEN
jgi:tetratricopeptide (TPR) repeat protein